LFYYEPADGERVRIGEWSRASLDRSPDAVVKLAMRGTGDRETAEFWRAELAAGRLPPLTENEP